MKQPLFSCVIPVKGDRPFFGEAIDSLKAQGLGDDLEIIVQDADVEPDAGQSDALNKGFAKAKGEWLSWLNADDVLLPGALGKVRDFISRVEDGGVDSRKERKERKDDSRVEERGLYGRVEHVDRVESGELHLLYLGRRHPLKGVEYLEKAVAELNSNPVNPVNSVQKTSTCSTRLKTSAYSASQRLCVKIISNAYGEELEKVWDWCDVLVLPTLSDNFGLVVAEALERGKRVITTDGAPAWGENLSRVERVDGGMWSGYGGRLIYIKGYRDGTPEDRVRLLKSAIENLLSRASLTPPAAK